MPTARGWVPPDGVKSVGVNMDALLGKETPKPSKEPVLERSSTEYKTIAPCMSVSDTDGLKVTIALGVRLESRANVNKHWRHTHKHKKDVNAALTCMMALITNVYHKQLAGGCVVEMCRVAPRALDKDDNLPMAFKGIKDTLAYWLYGGQIGRNDEREEVTWLYTQAKEGPKMYGVRINLSAKSP